MAGMMGKHEDGGLQEQLNKASEIVNMVLEIGMSGARARHAEEQLYDVLQTLRGNLNADFITILLREDKNLAAIMGFGEGWETAEGFIEPIGQGFAGKIAETKEHLYVHDARVDPIVISPYIKSAGIRSMLGVPLLYGGEPVGVLQLGWKGTHPFSEMELKILNVAAERCASAIVISRMCEINDDLNAQACMYLDIIEHDLKNLNKVMHEDLDSVLSIPDLDRDVKDTIEGVKRDLRESETIVDNVRVLYHTLNEDLPIETMDLDSLIQDAIKEVEWPETKNVGIHYAPEMGRVVNGTILLKDVFYTLVNNAIMCSRGDAVIDISVGKVHVDRQPFYIVSVIDDSQAIPDDVKEELFDFHFGVSQAHGKALPLFLVKLIVDRMGGSIMVENRVPGDYRRGSVFRVVLPAIEAAVIPEVEPVYR
ncbi:GAF domain-containing sensor histidine kinase [Methanocella conradii]|nr:GAF domain-containing sensor histidine kinase [Methanocella conradii]MDI6897628.1 GAF domain-containing sensor histidine kinase [Methanocella conradii]